MDEFLNPELGQILTLVTGGAVIIFLLLTLALGRVLDKSSVTDVAESLGPEYYRDLREDEN